MHKITVFIHGDHDTIIFLATLVTIVIPQFCKRVKFLNGGREPVLVARRSEDHL